MRFTKIIFIAGLALAGASGVAAADVIAPAPIVAGATEPAPGTYENGYVWVAGAYVYDGGAETWVAGHWQLAEPSLAVAPVAVGPRVIVRPGFGLRWRDPAWRAGWRGGYGYARGGYVRPYARAPRSIVRGRTARSYRPGSRW